MTKSKALQKRRDFSPEEKDEYLKDVSRHAFDEARKIAKLEAKLAYYERRLGQEFDRAVDVAPDEAALYAKRAMEFLVERRNLSAHKVKLLGLDAATRAGISGLVNPDDDAMMLEKIKNKIAADKQAAIEAAKNTVDAEVVENADTGSNKAD